MNTQKFSLHYPWDCNGYKPDVIFELSLLEDAFHLHINTLESNPKRDETTHLNYVHRDSCVEWFVNFAPELTNSYFNFEFNANGVLHAAFGPSQKERNLIDLNDIYQLDICAIITDQSWSIDFCVPFTVIQKYIPDFVWKQGASIRCNFYKCGDRTAYPHFGIWNPIDLPSPAFHTPDFFGELTF